MTFYAIFYILFSVNVSPAAAHGVAQGHVVPPPVVDRVGQIALEVLQKDL